MIKTIDDFFSSKNTIEKISIKEQQQTTDYLAPIKAFARTTYKSIYVIDYYKKGFEYVSENPLFLCGHTPEEIQNMGFDFYFKYVTEPDIELLFKINTIGFDFYEKIRLNERLKHTISYDFNLKNQEGKTILINQKLTPLFLNEEGKIWKAICIVSISNQQKSGNIKIYKQGENITHTYNLDKNYWQIEEKPPLSSREKEILQFSARGFKIHEIAKHMHVSIDTVKFHRKKLFEKLEVINITEAIAFSTNNKLI